MVLRSDKEVIELSYEKKDPKRGVWHLTTRDASTGSELEVEFDGVVVAVGMFDKTYVPDYEGLEEWKRRCPESLSHASTYRTPKSFEKKVSQKRTMKTGPRRTC